MKGYIYKQEENIDFSEEMSLFYLLSKKFVTDYTDYINGTSIDSFGYVNKLPSERFKDDCKYLRRILSDLAKKSQNLKYEWNEK